MQRAALLAAVFFISALFLATGVDRAGIATSWVDPVGHIQAQDEALYAASSQRMAATGDVLTPYFLDRLALYKPPLLYWSSVAGLRLFGNSRGALRMPAVLAGAVTLTVVFAWVSAEASVSAAWLSVVLLATSRLFFILSRVAMTDALLLCEILLSLYIFHRDPTMQRRRTVWIFGAVCGAAILTKAAAGLLPVGMAVLYCVFTATRPHWSAVARTLGIAALVAAPWHLYQLAIHPRWFWNEYVLQEHLAWGVHPPAQTSAESWLGFYGSRVFWLDPVLAVVGMIALLRTRSRAVLSCVVMLIAAIAAYRYRNATYLLPLLPAFAIAAGLAVPARFTRAAVGIALLVAGCKLALPMEPWGLPFDEEFVNPSYAALDAYAAQARGRELVVVDPDDQFYASMLSLPRVRYAYSSALPTRRDDLLDFAHLGIAVSAVDYASIANRRPTYERRLREFGMDTTHAIGTTIWASEARHLSAFIAAHPHYDFYLPLRWATLASAGRIFVAATGDRGFLLAPKR